MIIERKRDGHHKNSKQGEKYFEIIFLKVLLLLQVGIFSLRCVQEQRDHQLQSTLVHCNKRCTLQVMESVTKWQLINMIANMNFSGQALSVIWLRFFPRSGTIGAELNLLVAWFVLYIFLRNVIKCGIAPSLKTNWTKKLLHSSSYPCCHWRFCIKRLLRRCPFSLFL